MLFRVSEHAETAGHPAVSFHEDGQGEAETVTFAQLHASAMGVAAHLRRSTKPGDRVLLVYPPGLAYITTFIACSYAGVVAVPALPPTTRRTVPRLQLIAKDAQPALGLTLSNIAARIREYDGEGGDVLSRLGWLRTDELGGDGEGWVPPTVGPDDVAFLQYTSGSTAEPKAVMVTHSNIVANVRFIQATVQLETSDVVVSWLPPHHDMGLIGTMLYTIYMGLHSVQFPPSAFLTRPHRWLQLISQYKAQGTTAPNFAYDLCVKMITEEQKASMDLSSLVYALNGAEPVRPATVRRFTQAFAPCGLRAHVLTPVYGLAESTLLVSANALTQAGHPANSLTVSRDVLASGAVALEPEPADALILASHGQPCLPGQGVAIVDPVELKALPEDVVGEIWVWGPSVAKGYWNKPEQTEHTFGGRLPGSQQSYLRSGDLGFLHAGELYVTGRAKDMMIFNGRNVYPQDIEMAVERLDPSFRANGCAVFAVERNDRPRLVIVQELESRRRQPTDGVADRVRAELVEQHELVDLEAIVLVRPGHVPRTSSGKIQRSRCRSLYLAGELDEVWLWKADNGAGEASDAPPDVMSDLQTPTERRLARLLSEILGHDIRSRETNFFALGGNSLAATRLMQSVQDKFGVLLPIVKLFEHPKLHQLAGAIDRAARMQQAAVLLRIEPDPVNRFEKFPLTEVQQAYWLGRQGVYALGGVAAHVYQELCLDGVEPAVLNQALNRLIRRHDMLRAIVHPDGLQQVLSSVPPYEARYADLRGRPTEEAELELQKIRDDLSHQVLDAATWPLFEFRLTRVDDKSTLLHLSMDLLICDGRSGRILLSELAQLCREPQAELPALDLSFRDCVMAERAARDSQAFRDAKAYWDQRLADLPPAPELPLAVNPDTIQAPRFTRREHVLGQPQWARLKLMAAASEVTPSAMLLAAFAEVIGRWSRHPDFTINLTLFNRHAGHPQVDSVVGDFTSLVLCEMRTGRTLPFERKVQEVQARLWSDLDHSAVSAVQVMRDMARVRGQQGVGMPVVFTSSLVDAPEPAGASPGWLDDVRYGISQTPQVWLDHVVSERKDELLLVWDAVDALFPPHVLDRMFRTYIELLGRLCEDAQTWQEPAFDLMPQECRQAQQAANATEGPHQEELIHEAFDRQARLRPERIAVIAGETRLTYGALRGRSQRLAARLRHLGAAPSQPIAIVMAKGWEQVAAALAVSYSGACYLPLDPSLPAQRLQHILKSAQVSVVLTQPRFADSLALPGHITRVLVGDQEAGDPGPADLEPTRTSPSDLAYVIYTSGSTGSPKGVMTQHAAAVNTLQDINGRFGVSPDDRVLALSSLSFDLSVFDIFGMLSAGASVVLPDEWAALDPAHWLELSNAHHVSVWNSVPVFLEMLVDHARQAGAALPESLRLVMLSGDWIPLALPDRLRALRPSARVVSLGGATEASIWSIFHEIESISPTWKSIPYGKALRNQRMHVLDGALQPRPTWAVGEIFIGGKGLAAGYWRDEEKTRERFLVHPQTGERLYRTGDLGRYFPDGSIEFLGREDSQVKVQGHRIELGEVEAALLLHPAVERAAVIVAGEGAQGKRLAAYVVARPGAAGLTAVALRQFASERLPRYMVPSTFAFIDALPLSANGKIDKRALSALDVVQGPGANGEAAAGSADEHTIAQIVEEVLGMQGISRSENLLYLGANSIDLVRIGNALFARLRFRPQLDVFLNNPSIESLVDAYCRRGAGEPAAPSGLAIIEGAQERKAFVKRQRGRRTFDSVPRYVPLAPESRNSYSLLYGQYRSNRRFSQAPISGTDFAGLLACLTEGTLDGDPKYLYASAGGAYPIQTYVYVKPSRVQGIEAGAYYHDAKAHGLVATSRAGALPAQAYDAFVNRPIYEEAAFAVFFIARMSAIEPLYGEKSVDFCHIEAGAMAQLLMAAAAQQRIGLCGIGVVDAQVLAPLFDLDSDHRLVYSMVGGAPAQWPDAPTPVAAEHADGLVTGTV